MEADFLDLLLDDAGVAAIVGNRISPNQAQPGEELPRIVYTMPGRFDVTSNGGLDGLTRVKVLLELQAADRFDIEPMHLAVRSCLAGFKGNKGSTTFGAILPAGAADVNKPIERRPGPPTSGQTVALFRRMLWFDVWVNE